MQKNLWKPFSDKISAIFYDQKFVLLSANYSSDLGQTNIAYFDTVFSANCSITPADNKAEKEINTLQIKQQLQINTIPFPELTINDNDLFIKFDSDNDIYNNTSRIYQITQIKRYQTHTTLTVDYQPQYDNLN